MMGGGLSDSNICDVNVPLKHYIASLWLTVNCVVSLQKDWFPRREPLKWYKPGPCKYKEAVQACMFTSLLHSTRSLLGRSESWLPLDCYGHYQLDL